ncbi:uncharacterized protein LOC119387279 isoform X1 [Rhipicephalus sanguineus]|uniref:uncharacterized protein LOC119387279 isoform X1 n=1 Tax=Rhipicephalus sanguineus TaxID=34632 RepID=UPI00189307D3|nr:uncharacterized protein LOC119387279 isoform X1 [Rhipicephalus sanguineus]
MKSNGSNRGALRPHYGGRAPPFLLAALLIGLVLIGFCYYNLSSQYSALEMQYRDLQERLRAMAEKRESLETRHDELKKTLEDNSKSLDEKDKQLLQKEQERAAVEAALRKKEDELITKSREADTAAKALTGCLQRLNETSSKLSEKETSLAKLTSEVDALKAAVRDAETKAAAGVHSTLQKAAVPDINQNMVKEAQAPAKKEETAKELGNSLQDVVSANGTQGRTNITTQVTTTQATKTRANHPTLLSPPQ